MNQNDKPKDDRAAPVEKGALQRTFERAADFHPQFFPGRAWPRPAEIPSEKNPPNMAA